MAPKRATKAEATDGGETSSRASARRTSSRVAAPPKASTAKAAVTKKATTTRAPAKEAAATKSPAEKAPAKKAPAAKAKAKPASRVDSVAGDAANAEKPSQSRKRKADAEAPAQATKKSKTTVKAEAAARPKAEPRPKATPQPKVAKKGPVINQRPTQRLNVYVFGEGGSGELGLGARANVIDVKRPRLNPKLPASEVGVVQIATGGMHCAALTHDGKILTWGVNDQGALGRDTKWDGESIFNLDGTKVEDVDDIEEEIDSGLNAKESTPIQIPSKHFPEGTVFTSVAAGDSTTFAVTDEGKVWGWGIFRSNEGLLGFSKADGKEEFYPVLVPGLKNITKVACGANHALALDNKGAVFAWGSGQQNQLGRRVVERVKTGGLVPREFGLPKKSIVDISCGQYHSFAIDSDGQAWGWGLNSFGQAGLEEGRGDDSASVLPGVINGLGDSGVVCISGGSAHSVAVTKDGSCFTWGRADGSQLGLGKAQVEKVADDQKVFGDRGELRMVKEPTKVDIPGKVVTASASSEHCLAITADGKGYGWGFSANYQTALGTTETVESPTHIDNTAVREKKLIGCYTGGQFGVVTDVAA